MKKSVVFGCVFRPDFFVLWLCLLTMFCWNVRRASAADAPVNQETETTCVNCHRHEELRAKLSDLKQSARVLSHRVEKVGTKLDTLEQCDCVQK